MFLASTRISSVRYRGKRPAERLRWTPGGAPCIDDAVAIFKINVAAYPEASDPYDNLGEAYAAKGEKDLAITNYKKSLELDPKNENAQKWIEKLESGHLAHPAVRRPLHAAVNWGAASPVLFVDARQPVPRPPFRDSSDSERPLGSIVIVATLARGIVALAGLGALMGTLLALLMTSFMGSMLYGISSRDPVIYLAVGALMLLVGSAASLLSSRQVLKTDMMIALRSE